jgi:hypothetical protein
MRVVHGLQPAHRENIFPLSLGIEPTTLHAPFVLFLVLFLCSFEGSYIRVQDILITYWS